MLTYGLVVAFVPVSSGFVVFLVEVVVFVFCGRVLLAFFDLALLDLSIFEGRCGEDGEI